MRILVIRRDNIGDLVCTTPLFAALRARFPQAHIAALVNSYNAAVLERNPALDEVYSYKKLKHRLPGESRLGILLARLRMLAKLRAHAFDYILLAKAGYDRQGLSLARQLRRRHIVGFAEAEHAPAAITMRLPRPEGDLHEVQTVHLLGRALDVNDTPGPLRVYPDPQRVEAWRSRIPALKERTWIAVHISARAPDRIWPVERFVSLIQKLNAGVVLLWAPGAADDPRHPGDDARAAAIVAGVGAGTKLLPARTESVEDLIAILSLCRAFIGPDGGAMHLAAGLGLPIVALFENLPDKRRHWHPWQVPYEMVSPHTHDVADIPVERVAEAWTRLSAQVFSHA
jgi:ADP-heptose:LPS heptosyltransferase